MQAKELAEDLQSTPSFVPHVLRPLVRAGWVSSEPGRNGGYRLATALSDRSVLDLVELIEGPTEDGRCVISDGPCPGETRCALHDAWTSARRTLRDRLDASPISDRPTTTTTISRRKK